MYNLKHGVVALTHPELYSFLRSAKMPPVEIQWCDHSSVLLEYLRQLYEEGRFVDVGLECEGRQVKAHKAVISACSPYLEVTLV